MPLPILVLIAAAIGLALATATVVVISCWDRIVAWTKSSFLPWVDEYLPSLSELARRAFMSMHGVVREIRVTIREAWSALRTRLVKQVVEFSRASDNRWVAKTTSWVIAALGPDGNPQFLRHETTTSLSIDEVPPDLLAAWLRRKDNRVEVDLLKTRDMEITAMDMELGEENDE